MAAMADEGDSGHAQGTGSFDGFSRTKTLVRTRHTGSLATVGESKLRVHRLPRRRFALGARADAVISRDDSTSRFHV